MTPRRRLVAVALAVAVAAAVAAGCGGSDDRASLTVEDAWARATPDVATTASVYLRIDNGTGADDALVGAAVPAEVAAGLMLHRTVTEAADDGMDMSGMEEAPEITLPAGGSATLEPGGDHLMLMGLKARLETGRSFELQLVFRSGERLTTTVEVRDP